MAAWIGMDYSRFAHLYDSFVRFEDDLSFFVQECLKRQGRVLELMAGTGRVTVRLVDAGVRPTCVDRSREMLTILKGKLGVASPPVVCADVRLLPFSRVFSLAMIPFNSFAELTAEEDRHAALRSIRSALAPGGRLICTLHNPAVRLLSVRSDPTLTAQFPDPSGEGNVSLTIRAEFDEVHSIVRGMQTFTVEAEGRTQSEISVPIEFCLPSRAWFATAAGAAGFRVEALFGDYDRSEYQEESSRFMIWCLGNSST